MLIQIYNIYSGFFFILSFYHSKFLKNQSYIKAIESNIRKTSGQNNFKYDKASTNFYDLLQKYGNEDEACKRARQLREKYKKNKDFKMHNPRTEVDLLIEELKHPELL